jgi:hypothetical protein
MIVEVGYRREIKKKLLSFSQCFPARVERVEGTKCLVALRREERVTQKHLSSKIVCKRGNYREIKKESWRPVTTRNLSVGGTEICTPRENPGTLSSIGVCIFFLLHT